MWWLGRTLCIVGLDLNFEFVMVCDSEVVRRWVGCDVELEPGVAFCGGLASMRLEFQAAAAGDPPVRSAVCD